MSDTDLLEYACRVLSYDENSGTLYWKVKLNRHIIIGAVAGSVSSDGYRRIMVSKRRLLAHRIIFFIHNGFVPGQIDHIDGNKSNNHISNLREASQRENNWNTGIRKDNKSGVKGVYLNKRTGRWIAKIKTESGVRHIGSFSDIGLAESAIREVREVLHGGFANHG